ncbi:MAG: peptidylprolyl isomerase [Candidatus Limnocylindrales bacterium]
MRVSRAGPAARWLRPLLPTFLAGFLAACSAGATGSAGPVPVGSGSGDGSLGPPEATPLAEAPAEPATDGTTVTIETEAGPIVIELFNRSAPVASENFVNLAESGFYDGLVFQRIVPGYIIQGGDPEGNGSGGPGYVFPDEPFAGSYQRGTVAMANAGPDTNGSQFFIVVGDASGLPRDYTIFGRVREGLEVVDAIVSGPRGGPRDDQALEPVTMNTVTVERP